MKLSGEMKLSGDQNLSSSNLECSIYDQTQYDQHGTNKKNYYAGGNAFKFKNKA